MGLHLPPVLLAGPKRLNSFRRNLDLTPRMVFGGCGDSLPDRVHDERFADTDHAKATLTPIGRGYERSGHADRANDSFGRFLPDGLIQGRLMVVFLGLGLPCCFSVHAIWERQPDTQPIGTLLARCKPNSFRWSSPDQAFSCQAVIGAA